jgi:glycosyltransferase involved in cell wall biosynthesis
MAQTPLASIIIPAYNEAAVIGRTLDHLLRDAPAGDLEIIVCCNGCKDGTAEIARRFGPPVRVIETAKGSKTHALNLGDTAATSFPRIYLDADILLSYATVTSIVRALQDSQALAVAPRMRVDLAGRSWAVRAFYDVWLKTPYHLRGMIGSGVYALSEAGRKRFEAFPEIIADDGYVRAHFHPDERRVLEDCGFTIIPPASLGGLLRIKTRAALGNKELAQKYPALIQRLAQQEHCAGHYGDYWKLAWQPALWPELGVYAFVKSVAAVRARSQLWKLNAYRWERDETSRV